MPTSDILNDIHPGGLLGEKAVLERHWVPKMRAGRIDIRVVAIYTEPPMLPELACGAGLDLVASSTRISPSRRARPCAKPLATSGVRRKPGRSASSSDGRGRAPGRGYPASPHLLRARSPGAGTDHALRTSLADGAFFPSGIRRAGRGYGRRRPLLEEAGETGIVVDVSHLNDPSFWMSYSSPKPLSSRRTPIAGPSATISDLTDDQIKAVADRGGVVGVNACSVS